MVTWIDLTPLSLSLQDLENFETKARSAVSVREGQGVVLFCASPPHYGGNIRHFALYSSVFASMKNRCVESPMNFYV